jgi:methionyl aminopeptidase
MAIGQIVGRTLHVMGQALKPNMTTRELDLIGRNCLAKAGAHSAPKVVYNFPGYTCISVNEEAAHGVPGDRVIKPGDIVNIDVSAEKGGYFGDTGFTFLVEPVATKNQQLVQATKRALRAAMAVAKAGNKVNEIGKAIEQSAKQSGFKILRDLASHGIGRTLHEYPECIPSYFDKKDKRVLEKGMVITIEPFLSTRSQFTETGDDGWTLISGDKNATAQFEHTMIITDDAPILTTYIEGYSS